MLSREEILKSAALRWIQSLCLVPGSSYYGASDREYWAWKTKDFHNSTWIGGIAGFLDCSELLDFSSQELAKIVDATLQGARRIQRKNGSFEEAYPFEDSYAVTGLVLFNLLYVLRCYRAHFSPESVATLKEISSLAVGFLETHSESHGIIANHLVTSTSALHLAKLEFGQGSGDVELKKVLALQRPSGSFPEYGGADPGYQTLLNHYLVGALRAGASENLLAAPLKASLNFLENFAMPDGDFSGELGSRGTRVVYPSGICQHSGLRVWFESVHQESKFSMDPLQMDAGNFVPLFNAWALAFKIKNARPRIEKNIPVDSLLNLDEESLFLARNEFSMLFLNLSTGVVRSFSKIEDQWHPTALAAMIRGALCTQLGQAEKTRSSEGLRLKLFARPIVTRENTVLTAVVLRILAVIFRVLPFLHGPWKKFLAKFVMGDQGAGEDSGLELVVNTNPESLGWSLEGDSSDWTPVEYGFFRHMASANYARVLLTTSSEVSRSFDSC
jgi:hypothetical protein